MTNMEGTCRLCLKEAVTLRSSHIIPAWAYRRATARELPGNPHPVWSRNGRYFQTALQVQDYLLCHDCEQMIGQHENVVSRFAGTKDGPSSLINLPTKFPGLGWMEEAEGAHTLRFAIAVFLRAHFSSRRACRTFSLPADLAEDMRLFLIGKGAGPTRSPIVLTALDEPDGISAMRTRVSFPNAVAIEGKYRAVFVVCGLAFDLFYGEPIEEALFRVSLSNGSRPWVRIEPWSNRAGFVKWVEEGRASRARWWR
jgi:hypothetical protein